MFMNKNNKEKLHKIGYQFLWKLTEASTLCCILVHACPGSNLQYTMKGCRPVGLIMYPPSVA